MKKIILYFLTFIFLFFASPSFSIDQEIKDIVDTIDAAKKDFNDVDTSKVIEAVKIDKAFEQIDKVTEFVKESLQDGNEDSAIKALEFIEKSLAGTNALVPQKFSSDMSDADIFSFGEDKMAIVNDITTDMKTTKEEKLNDLVSGMVDISKEGIDSFGIVEELDKIGVQTIDIAIAIKNKEKMETWTKEEWAGSWKGDILTDDGKQIISDDEINLNLTNLEQKLQANNLDILNKKSSLTELQTKINPLSGEITTLKTKKTELLAKYNEEILKQSSLIMSDEEINKSKQLADEFNSQLDNLTSQIKIAEKQSDSLQQQVQNLNLELANEISIKAELEQNISNLNNRLLESQNLLSKKELELDQLRNTDLNSKVNELNSDLETVSRERDFIQTDFERSIDLEVEALKRYHTALGTTAEEIDFAVREVDVILDSDPRKARAFEIEKYATYAGFSKDQIQKGIDAVNNDDWDTQKEVFKDITNALSKNPDWEVDVPSNSEFNVMIEEEKAIQAAVFQSIELAEVKKQVENSINDKTKDLQPLLGLNTTTLRYAVTWEGMAEHEPLMAEIDKVLGDNQEIKIKQNQIDQLRNSINEFNNNKDKEYSDYQNQIAQAKIDFNNIEQEIRKHNQKSDWGNSSWVNKRQQLVDQRINMFYDRFAKFEDKTNSYQTEINRLNYEMVSIRNKATTQARENLINKVDEAKIAYDSIIKEESKELKEMQSKVASSLKEVPTFADSADFVSASDPAMLRAELSDIINGNNNEAQALEAARKAMSEMGNQPVSKYMTGPYWEMTNVKAAAIVRSKKYDYVDDYEYINAYYRDPLELNSSQRAEIEGELKNVLGKNNIKLKAINAKVDTLTKELNLAKEQSQNFTTEISTLENELSSLKTSETEIKNQIIDLSNQFSSKEALITKKQQSLTSLQEQLNPLSNKMNELESQRAELDTKLNSQLNTIANQIESQGKATDEANSLKAQFESQIAQLDTELQNYEKQSFEINNELTSLTTELNTLEMENPEISEKISKLNTELGNLIEIKADLAMTQAIKSGITVNERIVDKVAKLQNKSIIQIDGTNLMRVVDTNTLTNEAGQFEVPVGTFTNGNTIYLAGAVSRQQILSIGKINETGDLNIKLSKVAAEKINSGMFGLEAAKGLMATDQMAKGVYSLIDPKTGRQVIDNHTGRGLYGGIICDGTECGPSGNLGKKVAASGYAFVRTGDIDQGGMCGAGNCTFNISNSELQNFNTLISKGVESPYAYDDALAGATINTKGLVADPLNEVAGAVSKEFYSGGFSIMEEGGAEALLQKAKDAVTRMEKAKAAGQKVNDHVLETAKAQVAAEQSVVDAVNAAKEAASSTTQVASAAAEAASIASQAASEAAQEVTQVVQAAAHEVIDGVRAQKNVVQLIQNGDGTVDILVGRTGVNVTGDQKVLWSGLTDTAANQGTACSSGNSAGCADHKKAQAEAYAASGIECTGNSCGDGY